MSSNIGSSRTTRASAAANSIERAGTGIGMDAIAGVGVAGIPEVGTAGIGAAISDQAATVQHEAATTSTNDAALRRRTAGRAPAAPVAGPSTLAAPVSQPGPAPSQVQPALAGPTIHDYKRLQQHIATLEATIQRLTQLAAPQPTAMSGPVPAPALVTPVPMISAIDPPVAPAPLNPLLALLGGAMAQAPVVTSRVEVIPNFKPAARDYSEYYISPCPTTAHCPRPPLHIRCSPARWLRTVPFACSHAPSTPSVACPSPTHSPWYLRP
jgi:hypothetical protein